MTADRLTVAVMGNPNAGKSTLFNVLTGSRQKVTNWPGTTVACREGQARLGETLLRLVDLPGTYSLVAQSRDQEIALEFMLREQPNVLVNILDAANLERNLYLTMQLLETGWPLVLVLNMADVARRRGIEIDIPLLADHLCVPVVETVAPKREGTGELARQIAHANLAANPAEPDSWGIDYGPALESVIAAVADRMAGLPLPDRATPRSVALTMLEGNQSRDPRLERVPGWHDLTDWFDAHRGHWATELGDDPAILLAGRRYEYIRELADLVVHRPAEKPPSASDRVDRLAAHPWIGLPILALVLFATFQVTFGLADPVVNGLVSLIDAVSRWAATSLAAAGAPDWFAALLIHGVLAGLGTLAVFLPNVAFLFLALSILEDSGYFARAAFVVESLMSRVGLPGKAFVPMVLGFGCSVPAILGTRILENRNERLATVLITPFMSCSARFPVYVLIASVFFPGRVGLVVFALYALGALVAFGSAWLFRHTLLPGPTAPFILELPGYKLPTPLTVGLAVWQRTWAFFRRAGLYIFIGSVALWFLGSMPWGVEYNGADSWLGSAARWLEPVVRPLGLAWKEGMALLIGFAAKELVLGALAVLYAGGPALEAGTEGIQIAMAVAISPAAAAGMLVFVLLYVPCFAALSSIRAETLSWRLTAFQVAYSLAVAWLGAFLVYQAGRALGFG